MVINEEKIEVDIKKDFAMNDFLHIRAYARIFVKWGKKITEKKFAAGLLSFDNDDCVGYAEKAVKSNLARMIKHVFRAQQYKNYELCHIMGNKWGFGMTREFVNKLREAEKGRKPYYTVGEIPDISSVEYFRK